MKTGEVADEEDDTIEANLSPLPPTATSSTVALNHRSSSPSPPLLAMGETPTTPPPDYTYMAGSSNNEPLRPIREEKSQESLDVKNNPVYVSIDPNKGIPDVQSDSSLASTKQRRYSEYDEDSSLGGDDSMISINLPHMRYNSSGTAQSPSEHNTTSTSSTMAMIGEDSRMRSISLTEDGATSRSTMMQDSRSPRSASFSGAQQHKTLSSVGTRISMRAGSDPGLGVTPHSLAGSMSSQDSDVGMGGNKRNFNKKTNHHQNHRRKSRSENSDISEHGRSNSILSDYGTTPGTRLRMAKRLRGGSNVSLGVSLGVSPKSGRSESPLSRDGAFGYTAWNTLKKQRSFKKELDWNLKRHLNVSDKRRFGRLVQTFYMWRFPFRLPKSSLKIDIIMVC